MGSESVTTPVVVRFDRRLFTAWPFAAFILPAMICWGFGDIESYLLASASWFVIPISGLLGLIPYFTARSRGWKAVPGHSIAVLILNWWAWIIVACSIPGKLTGGGGPSVLELLTFRSMSPAWTERIFITASIIGAVSWVALLITVKTSGEPWEPSRLQRRLGLGVAIGVPCLALLVSMLGGAFDNVRTDAAGERPEFASARSIEEQLDLLAQREGETQASLSEVRKLIAVDGWKDATPWLFSSCFRETNPCYDVYASAFLERPTTDRLARTKLTDDLFNAGWQTTKKPEYCHSLDNDSYINNEGQRLCVGYSADRVSVSMVAPSYWGDLFALRNAANPDAPIFNPRTQDKTSTYRWDEWQASELTTPAQPQ